MVLVYDVSSCVFLYRAELREFDAPIVGSHSTELAYAQLELAIAGWTLDK